MKFPTTITLLCFAVKALAHGDQALESIDTATIKTSFADAQIVPEILAAFNPNVSFYAGFASADGDAALMTPGMKLSVAEAKQPFELSMERPATAPPMNPETRYIAYLIGPDVPSRSVPTSRNVLHYLSTNLTLSTTPSSLLNTSRTLTNNSAPLIVYSAPSPKQGTGIHRYIWLLYAQPVALNTRSLMDLPGFGFTAEKRVGFNTSAFRQLAGLGPAVGGTFFVIDTDGNGTAVEKNGTVEVSGAGRVGGGGGFGVGGVLFGSLALDVAWLMV